MPKTLKTKIPIAVFDMPDGSHLDIPVLNPEYVWLNQTAGRLAAKLATFFEKDLSQNGEYVELMRIFPDIQLEQHRIVIGFEASPQNLFPAIELHFDMFRTQTPQGVFCGFVPILGLTSTGATPEGLDENMKGNIRLLFSRNQLMNNIFGMLSSQVFQRVSLIESEVSINVYSLNERPNIGEKKRLQYLPVAARAMRRLKKSAYKLDENIRQIEEAMLGKFSRSVLVTGRSGVGKSALIREFVFQMTENRSSENTPFFWETNASFLINKLVGDMGWEENFSMFCKELRDRQDVLYVENFAELFEVGQYEGNNISLADHLKEYLKRGDLTLITECTGEQLAAIELRSSGYSELFHIIKLEEPPADDLLNIIRLMVADLAGEYALKVNEDAIKLALQLQKRFTPYSGFPGKTISFFDNLINEKRYASGEITHDQIMRAFCEETGMPRALIDPESPFSFDEMEAHFRRNIFGQDEAVQTVVNMLATVKAGLVREGKPIASFLFIGPTGVGKTELAKVLAEYVFGNRNKVIRYDMSEYSDVGAVLRLTGNNMYSTGLLVDAVRQEPFSVVLFDELEKAHPVFFDLLLQILGEGRLTDARGNMADFCSAIIIMTSNIGARNLNWSVSGFGRKNLNVHHVVGHFQKEVQKFFRPELFNRLDRIVSFLPLSREVIRKVVDREISLIQRREGLFFRKVELKISVKVLDKLGAEGYDEMYGARHLQRVIRRDLIIPLAKALNSFGRDKALVVKIFVEDKQIQVNATEKTLDKQEKKEFANKLRLKNLIGEITESRREFQRIQNGPIFHYKLSQLDILNMNKKTLGDMFYKVEVKVNQSFVLENLVNKVTTTANQIADMEIEAMKVFFELADPAIDLQATFSNLLDTIYETKMHLYKYLHPNDTKITLAIYGSPKFLRQMYEMYQHFIVNRKFSHILWGVFLDDATKKSRSYIHKQEDTFEKIVKHAADDDLVGIEMEISGDAVHLYFNEEQGITEFQDGFRGFRYIVMVGNPGAKTFKTPENIHRKQAFMGTETLKLRRIISEDLVEDKIYKLKIAGSKIFHHKLSEILDQKFEKKLMQILCYGKEEE